MFIGIWCLVFGASAQPASVQQWLAAQTNLQTWSADLTQTRRLKSLAQPLVSTGQVWFAAPNKFRWEIGSPAQTIAVRSGDEMFVIYPRLKRAERYPLSGDKMGQWKDTLGLLEAGFPRSHEDIERQFRIVSVTASNDVSNVLLEPKFASARKMMPRITVSFSTNDFTLRATELQFGDGSVMRNDFRNGKINPHIDDTLFTPQLGADFKIVEPMKR
ncbi:MAG TPA: outer membrane lipoprotein carrier protein LolA [Candidatus Acidoferrum sp.]|nr:outer membrane lipoprotein carrier protein LolA [Candidatus Acidoferrum sp.]